MITKYHTICLDTFLIICRGWSAHRNMYSHIFLKTGFMNFGIFILLFWKPILPLMGWKRRGFFSIRLHTIYIIFQAFTTPPMFIWTLLIHKHTLYKLHLLVITKKRATNRSSKEPHKQIVSLGLWLANAYFEAKICPC